MLFRWLFGLPAAALVTVLLFIFMHALISQDAGAGPVRPIAEIDILAKIKPTPPKPPTPARPEPLEEPVTPVVDIVDPQPNPGSKIVILPPAPIKGTKPDINTAGAQPTIKPPPAYPEGCRSKGAQGTVIVEFDVTAEGNVVNPRIIASADACFDRTVIKTALGWRYTPKIVDGRAAPQYGVRETLNFQLSE